MKKFQCLIDIVRILEAGRIVVVVPLALSTRLERQIDRRFPFGYHRRKIPKVWLQTAHIRFFLWPTRVAALKMLLLAHSLVPGQSGA